MLWVVRELLMLQSNRDNSSRGNFLMRKMQTSLLLVTNNSSRRQVVLAMATLESEHNGVEGPLVCLLTRTNRLMVAVLHPICNNRAVLVLVQEQVQVLLALLNLTAHMVVLATVNRELGNLLLAGIS